MNRIILYLFVIASLGFADQSNAISLEEIKTIRYSQVNAIESIQFKYSFVNKYTYTDGTKTRENQGNVEYLQNGNLYFIKTEICENGKTEVIITAFDGNKYQYLGKNGRHEIELDFKTTELTDSPNLFLNPIIFIYSWLLDGSSKAVQQKMVLSTYSDVKNEDLWDDCFKNAIILEPDNNSNPRLRFNNIENEVVTEVTFDRNHRFFPHDLVTNFPDETVHIDDIIVKKDSEGNVFDFAHNMIVISQYEDMSISSTYQIDPDSIIVNGDIDKDKFTIPESMADTVIDVDAAEANKEIVPRPNSSVYMKICLGVLGLILITVGIYGKRRNIKTAV